MNPLFNSISLKKPKRNVFDLSHEKKLSMNMGDLVPILVQEVVPGDKFKVNTEALLRMAPMIAPVMHRVNVFTHYFFVPNRLVYDSWETFITGGVDGQQLPSFPLINITAAGAVRPLVKNGTLSDYMGVPPTPASGMEVNLAVNALPFRAYQLIYNEYYRDQTLSDPVPLTKNGTVLEPEAVALLTMRKRCWEKDYFTSALPFAQRGGEVTIPINGDLDAYPVNVLQEDGTSFPLVSALKNNGINDHLIGDPGSGAVDVRLQSDGAILNAQATINDLRRATKLQEWLEKNARGGSRYIEQIFSHFGVRSSDARLQRPEYLGGGKNPVVISEVLNTSATDTAPQGNMSGHGISVGNQNTFSKFFEEHGFIIGIMSVLPRTAYQQGIPKYLLKIDKFDYYFPEFAHLGEQEIQQREVYFDYTTDNQGLFGYTPRFAEYKFANSEVHGDFKDSMSYWHMGRIFESKPALNETFVSSSPTHRVFAVTDPSVNKLYVQLYNSVRAIRPMPVFGTPSF